MKIFKMASFTAVVISTALFAGSVYAGSCSGDGHSHSAQEMALKYFSQMDTNEDALVSKAEFEASPMTKFVKNFDVLNPNAKGFVEKESFLKMFIEAHSKKPLET